MYCNCESQSRNKCKDGRRVPNKDATYAVAKRKPERLVGIGALTFTISVQRVEPIELP